MNKMNLIIILVILGVVILIPFLFIKQNYFNIYYKKLVWKFKKPEEISYNETIDDNISTLACTDLGAFYKTRPNKIEDIEAIVIMEDRFPEFFLTYDKFEPKKDAKLNRHGPIKELKTQENLKKIIDELNQQNIKVYFGFWSFQGAFYERRNFKWLRDHPELKNENYFCSFFDPLKNLEKEKISFAEYVCNQYEKIQRDFGFDGLFLGDGLNGYQAQYNINLFTDKEKTTNDWVNFYKTIASKVHSLDGKLLAYDCLGLDPDKTKLHGANYKKEVEAGLDYLIVQTYPVAFGEFWHHSEEGYDLESSLNTYKKIKELLKETNCKTIYCLELGDSIEGWHFEKEKTLKQKEAFSKIADGKFLVWANDLFVKKNK